jgi:drug/metabolite transporter (DMT)-like permease
LEIEMNLVLGLEVALAFLLGIGWLGEALSARKLAALALILAGVMSLRLEGAPKAAATAAAVDAAPSEDARGALTPLGRRHPCQNTNHAPCR